MMKKLTALTLCLILCLAAAVTPAHASRVTKIQKAIAKDGDKALWDLVNTHYATSMLRQAGYADLYIWSPDGPVFPTQGGDDYQMMTHYTVKMQETAGIGFTLEQIVTYSVRSDGMCSDFDITQGVLPDGPVHIDPCGFFSYNAGCPADGNNRYEIIVAVGTDDNGHELEFYGVVQRLNILPGGTAENPDYDTENLRYEADYEIEVASGVWWVPAVSLGKSRYTNREIAGMVEHTPEEKQQEISTLYEALQLYQISNFCEADDNVRLKEGKIDWEHHKPGYDAVRTNCGCCATDSNWLNYILNGDYEQVGFIAYSQPNGSGHIFNYICQDGWYYFIDLTHYRTDFLETAAPETGLMGDYRNSDRAAGSLHKAKAPEDYIRYCLDIYNEPPARYFLYQAADCLPLDGVNIDGRMTITYPEGYDIRVIDGKDPQTLDVQFVKGPKKTYKWSSVKTAVFRVDEKYLDGGENAADTEPLTAYKPGDVLSLEDYSQSGFAVVDGTDYTLSRNNDVRIGFEDDLLLYGMHNNGYFDLRLPLGLFSGELQEMDSLVLGDLTVGIARKVPRVQILICTRDGDLLTVQEAEDGVYYDSRQISIYKDENGSWPKTPEYWYLVITDNGGTEYTFGRFWCDVTDEGALGPLS